uniref:Uncharacterized protein n=1 Tax=Amphimedon queenslandica TaxID=400682 RepID=A0A1X7SX79_AMPQE
LLCIINTGTAFKFNCSYCNIKMFLKFTVQETEEVAVFTFLKGINKNTFLSP